MLSKRSRKRPAQNSEIGRTSEKLGEHVACCRTMDGSHVYFRQSVPNEVLSESETVPSENLPRLPLKFAGEMDNKLYFYTERDVERSNKKKIYTFFVYTLEPTLNATTGFRKICNEPNASGEIKFALQQPYYYEVVERAITVQHFERQIRISLTDKNSAKFLEKSRSAPFNFLVWRNRTIIIYKNDENITEITNEMQFEMRQLCAIAVGRNLPDPVSLYTRDCLYLLCGSTLIIFKSGFSFNFYEIELPCYLIGGVEDTYQMYLNAPRRFFSYDVLEAQSYTPTKSERMDAKKKNAQQLRETREHLKQCELSSCDFVEAKYISRLTNDYEIEKILACKERVCVFGALNKYDKIKYAVKRIAVDRRNVETDLAEVRAMANLEHTAVVRYNSTWLEEPPVGWQHSTDEEIIAKVDPEQWKLLNYRHDSLFIYIKMELGDQSLADWIAKNRTARSRNLDRMKSFFRQIVSGVEYIHSKEYIHRDLKPGNILFFNGDRLKICDMGLIAEKTIVNGVEKTTTMPNGDKTPLYMSPEQDSNWCRLRSNSDVFSLGLIFAELCVIMDFDRRGEIFGNYRRGDHSKNTSIYSGDDETAEFVASLTSVSPHHRPSCTEILRNRYLLRD